MSIGIPSGGTERVEIEISGLNGGYVKGLAYSSDIRTKVLNSSYGGYKTKVVLEVSLRPTDDEADYTAVITLITNGGEFTVPVNAIRKSVSFDDVLSGLQTLNDLAKIAKEDRDAALRIFEYRNFRKAPCMADSKAQAIYNNIITSTDKNIALEQFLLGCGIDRDMFDNKDLSDNISDFNSEEPEEHAKDENEYSFANERRIYLKKAFLEYSKCRLLYETGNDNRFELLLNMQKQLDILSASGRYGNYIVLLKAELAYLSGDTGKAEILINTVSESIMNSRQENLYDYFLLEYLNITALGKRSKVPSYIRLCRKFIEEEHMHSLFFYVVKLDQELTDNVSDLHDFLTDVYNYGSRSPWLYLCYTKLINEHPEYLYNPKGIDNQSINFAKKYNILSDKVGNAVVEASCTAFIKADRRSVSVHKIYSDGIDLGLQIFGLYEYYMYSLPRDENYIISDKVINHYKDGDDLDNSSRIRLYANVVKFKNHNSGIYRAYESRIYKLALQLLNEGAIDTYTAELYKGVLRPANIDKEYGENLYKICNTFLINTGNRYLRSIVVIYPQFRNPEVFMCKDGNAAVQIYDEKAVILFQDIYGNRYYEIPYEKTALFSSDSLKSHAERLSPENVFIRSGKCEDLISKKILNSEDVTYLENAVYTLDLSESFSTLIINRLIRYYNQHTATGYNPDFLLRINKKDLNKDERQDLCNAYISCGCYDQAIDMISVFGTNGISDKNLKTLCSRSVSGKCDDKVLLTYLSVYTFNSGMADNTILEYLAENYNGPTDQMFRILKKCIDEKTDTYDLEERLLAQIIFTNDFIHIDRVFEWYVSRKQVSESIIKAYFTLKSVDYFINNADTDDKVFAYLEKIIDKTDDTGSIPSIFMLALTKHYSESDRLNEKRIETAQRFIKHLYSIKIVFPYFRKFRQYFDLPDKLLNSAILVFRNTGNNIPELYSRICPQDRKYHQDAFSGSYMNLYIKQKILFEDEEWSYMIKTVTDDNKQETIRGSLALEEQLQTTDRYDAINTLCRSYTSENDNETGRLLTEYIKKDYIYRNLFKF